MQNAGQYVPGTANAHQPQQFVPSEPSPNGGSTTSSLRQFRKRDVDKSQLEQPPKQESHVARVAPHNHYPPVSNDLYRYPPHQFSEYSPQVKYSDIADASPPNPISTSVIQKPKPKDYMEMCNVQQQHLNNQQQYSSDNGPYIHRDPTQGYPPAFKPEAHYLTKDQHQYQQLAAHHNGQPKNNPMMTQNMRKYNLGHADNPFLNKLSKIHPSMARSIISDHHLQEPQPSYPSIDQRGMYGQQNHRYYTGSLHQPNPYASNPNYSINPANHYPNYPPASCSYPRTSTITPRYSHMERSMSPTRRGYPENVHMGHLPYQSMPQRIQASHNYALPYAGGPEYAQHYQHRRMGQDCYPQPCRPTQYMQNHHQIPAQEMPELPESRISPSDSLKKFIENWAADEEPSNEINPMDGNMNLRDNIKVRDDAPPGTVYMINATDVQYFENNGIPIVTSDNGGIQLTSENYQYLLKNGLVDNSGMVRIIEANKELSIDSSGNHERIVNLQIMETSKSDCMMVNKALRPSDSSVGPNGILPKTDDERRVVIHQNTVISSGTTPIANERIPSQQLQTQTQSPTPNAVVENISICKELVDKNCSPINLDQLEHNLGFSEPDPPETEREKYQNSSIPVSTVDSNLGDSDNSPKCKPSEKNLSDDLSQNSDDSQNKSPGSKSMPIIDLFSESQVVEIKTPVAPESQTNSTKTSQEDTKVSVNNEKCDTTDQNSCERINQSSSKETSWKENVENNTEKGGTICSELGENFKAKQEKEEAGILDLAVPLKKNISDNILESPPLANSVIVSPEFIKRDSVPKEETKCLDNSGKTSLQEELGIHLNANQKMDSLNTSETLINESKEELTSETSPISEVNQTEFISENLRIENKTKPVDEYKTPITTPTIERRKRIFSVDHIMNHIGNNMKRGSRDADIFCSVETLTTFIENEVEFSSLEQTLNLYSLQSCSGLVEKKDILSLDDGNEAEVVKSNESLESDIADCAQVPNTLEIRKDCHETITESEENLETTEPEITRVITPVIDELTSNSNDDEIVDDKKLQKEISEDEIISAEDNIQTVSDSTSLPVVLEPDERSSTPNLFQYRSAIRIEETSVLLQIAGELMEINVNNVNGKKVITVVPLSETTAVDYNDNYEVSATCQDTETVVQADDSEIESEKTEYTENIKDNEYQQHIENNNQKQSSALLENQKETPTTDEDLPDALNNERGGDKEEENKKDVYSTTDKCLEQAQKAEDVKENEFEENKDGIEAKHDNFQTNQLSKTDKLVVDDSQCLQEVEFKCNEANIDNSELPGNSTMLKDVAEAELPESQPEVTETKKPEMVETCEDSSTAIQVSKVNEETNIEEFVAEETVKSIDDSNIVEIYETPRTPELITVSDNIQVPEAIETNPVEKIIEKAEKIEETQDSMVNSPYPGNVIDVQGTIVQKLKEKNNDTGFNVQSSSLEPKMNDSEHFFNSEDTPYLSTKVEEVKFFDAESFDDNEVVDDESENDIDTDNFSYPLEDDVFISAEPSHEIIISDPIEDVGLIEEIEKTSDSFEIPLEALTASGEILEISETLSTKIVENIQEATGNDCDKSTLEKSDDIVNEFISKEPKNVTLPPIAKEEISRNLDEKADESKSEKISIVKIQKHKELLIKISKPEVQILSPTSTNIDDHVTASKENVYLEPRRKLTTEDEPEGNSVTVTTKAAKKLYECDLQIPAVTTSGDVITKCSKKSMKCQHDTVSSSKKERVVKELSRSRKSTLKRSKRINEKNQTKTAQKEILRLLAEKRKERKKTKQKELIAPKDDDFHEGINNNLSIPDEEILKPKQKHSTETDDEYVDFKELLRARKMRKLKKMQELKRREAKDTKIKTEDVNKTVKAVNSSTVNKKAVNVNKLNVVSSSLSQESTAEIQTKCCIAGNSSTKKSEKDDKQKSKKRKNSSGSKSNDEIKAKTAVVVLTLEAKDSKSTIMTSLPTEGKPCDEIVDRTKAADVDENTSTMKPELPVEIKSTNSQAAEKIDLGTEENVKTPLLNLETTTENNHVPKKIKLKKRVSFCDDISSSTLHIEKYGLPVTNDVAISKKAHSLNPKDPRRRSKSYSGNVMVPSVSELIDENNGAVCKKKISLADYVSRKRKSSTEKSDKERPEEKERPDKKKAKFDSVREKKEVMTETVPNSCKSKKDESSYKVEEERNSYKSEEYNRSNYISKEGNRSSKKTIKDVKTSFVIHSSDWEDSQSPLPTIVQSNDECLIEDFSGLIKSKSKRPVIDINELNPLETLENPKDKKLQEYKDKVDSQLSSLNIQIPKVKPQILDIKRHKLSLDPYGSPESSRLINKFLSNEKVSQSEMEKIKKIISYKRIIQHQKNSRSPSKSPASSSSTYSQSISLESASSRGKSPVNCGSAYSASPSDPTYEIKNHVRPEADSREMRLHLKRVNAKRKLHIEYEAESSNSVNSSESESRYKKTVDYSVINRLGKDGLPKIIFKRNRQSNVSDDNQLVVELERIDNNLKLVEEKYNVTVRR